MRAHDCAQQQRHETCARVVGVFNLAQAALSASISSAATCPWGKQTAGLRQCGVHTPV